MEHGEGIAKTKHPSNVRYVVVRRPDISKGLKVIGKPHRALQAARDAKATQEVATRHPLAIYLLAFGKVPEFVEGANLTIKE